MPACAQCHGAGGQGMAAAGFPELAGQNANYLAKQLSDYAAGRRANPVMSPIAKALDPAAMQSVAAYYQALVAPPKSSVAQAQAVVAATAGASSPNASVDVSLGARLAQRGDWDHDIPACFACHGDAGGGIGAHFPRIAGQNRAYTERQLNDWKNNVRANDPQGLMKAVADRLSDAEISAVAVYLERLPSKPSKP
ncbi:MAG: c-type cytochrome [Burkholderiales bacterium]